MTHLGIAALQLDHDGGDNLDKIAAEVASAKRRLPWVQLVLLGELGAKGPSLAAAEPMPGPTEQRFQQIARDNAIWFVPGSIYERAEGKVFNTTPVIDPAGQVVTRYRKIYPFLPYEQGVAAGDAPGVFEVPGVGRIGLSICYDMWFPETTRALAWLGAEVILHPSMTNTIDRSAEQAICRATAAINQCWFVDLNVAGPLGMGGSVTYGPGGELAHQAGSGREVIALDLDLAYVRRVRERGWHGLGQPLKSFRDGPTTFAPYGEARAPSPTLSSLGPLAMPSLEGGEA